MVQLSCATLRKEKLAKNTTKNSFLTTSDWIAISADWTAIFYLNYASTMYRDPYIMDVQRSRYDATGHRILLCNGKRNTCGNAVRKSGDACAGCRVGDHHEGDVYVYEGVKYVRRSGGSYRACTEDGCNVKCRLPSAYCAAHGGNRNPDAVTIRISDNKEIRSGVHYGRSDTSNCQRWYKCCEWDDCTVQWTPSRNDEKIVSDHKYCRLHMEKIGIAQRTLTTISTQLEILTHAMATEWDYIANDMIAGLCGLQLRFVGAHDRFMTSYNEYIYKSTIATILARLLDIEYSPPHFTPDTAKIATTTCRILSQVPRNRLPRGDVTILSTLKPMDTVDTDIIEDEPPTDIPDQVDAPAADDMHENINQDNPPAEETVNADNAIVDDRVIRPPTTPIPEWAIGLTLRDDNGIDRVLGEIYVGRDGKRRIASLGSGKYTDGTPKHVLRPKFVCNGLANTCTADAKTGGKCNACLRGGLGVIKRELAADRTIGKIVLGSDGFRRFYDGKQTRTCCIGNNNTCKNARENGDLCRQHTNNSTPRIKGLVKGDELITPTYRGRHDGKQMKELCRYGDGICNQHIRINGHCKTHAPEYRCKYAGGCTKIVVINTDYCKTHENGVVNKRNKSRLEMTVMRYLIAAGIKYLTGCYVRQDVTTLRTHFSYDFYLPEYEVFIEADGIQHFMERGYWEKYEPYGVRVAVDRYKDQYAFNRGFGIIRLHHLDISKTESFIYNALTANTLSVESNSNLPRLYVSPSFTRETHIMKDMQNPKVIECDALTTPLPVYSDEVDDDDIIDE